MQQQDTMRKLFVKFFTVIYKIDLALLSEGSKRIFFYFFISLIILFAVIFCPFNKR